MASSSTPPSPHFPHGTAWLLCAACGPLAADEAKLAGVDLSQEPGLQQVERLYEVVEPPPFPELHRAVAADAALREALEQVETARNRMRRKKRALTHAEMAGRARAALLLGKGKVFMRYYSEYAQERPYEWHPDPEQMLFWDSVLGPGWAGSAHVPASEARRAILRRMCNAYAFFEWPTESVQGEGLCGAPEYDEWLEMAAAIRVVDTAAVDERLFEFSSLASTANMLFCGAFDQVQVDFERLFGRAGDGRYSLVQRDGLPLLVYALVAGVYAHGGQRVLSTWFESARYAVQYIFPPSMARQEAQLMRFLDHLEVMDSLVNRRGCLLSTPQFNGALSQLPFAMFYTSLPAYAHACIPADSLVEGVLELERSGLRLLACYGAMGLQKASQLSAAHRAQLEALVERTGIAPFLPPPSPPLTQQAFEALSGVSQRLARHGSRLRASASYASPPILIASRMESGISILLQEEGEEENAALRCMRKYAAPDGLLVLEGASPAEFTRLLTALQPQVEIAGSLALPGEAEEAGSPQPVILLAHEGKGRFLAGMRMRLLPGSPLLLHPGAGLEVPVLERADGSSANIRRNFTAEWGLVQQTAERLQQAGIARAADMVNGVATLEGFAALAELLKTCRELGLECCWEQGYALSLHQPRGGLRLQRGKESGDWLELGGDLPVDEGRVCELSILLEAFVTREGQTLCLGEGEYVQLNPVLERQLALLELVWQEKHGTLGVAAAALPLFSALEGGDSAPAATPAPIPAGLRATLRPYQAEGFRWLVERAEQGMGALLADDMGLGKTVQVLALLLHAAAQPGAGAALVLAPVSLLGNWAEEAARFAPSLQVCLYDPRKADALCNLPQGALVLASYGQLASRLSDFTARTWNLLVLDEAQAIKNPDSQRARAACSLQARARFCLTGTPIENSLLDVWSQMRLLNPGLLGTRAAFQRRFKKARPEQLALLRQVLAPLILRRTKGQVLTQLPPLTESVAWVDFSREERALYESLRRAAVAKLGDGAGNKGGGVGVLAELTRLRRACCHGRLAWPDFAGKSSKITAMVERVLDLRAAGRRVLVFSQFTDVLDLAQAALQSEGVTCLRLDGSTAAAQRNKTVKAFQAGQADAFLISLKAGGAGLNLTAADYVILLDPWWNPAVEAQAAGRSHRMGQAQPVTLCRFEVRGSVEERILDMHRDKKELAEQVLSGMTEGMSLANLRALLG